MRPAEVGHGIVCGKGARAPTCHSIRLECHSDAIAKLIAANSSNSSRVRVRVPYSGVSLLNGSAFLLLIPSCGNKSPI